MRTLGFWAALGEVWPTIREQGDWFHVLGNVLDKLPKHLQPKPKQALHEVMYAASKSEAEEAIERFDRTYADRYPEAVASLRRDQERLLTFFDFPAERRALGPPPRATPSSPPSPPSACASGSPREPGSRTKGLAMAFKLLEMAQQRWGRLNGSELLPLVRAGVRFIDGLRDEQPHEKNEEEEQAT